LSKIFGDRLRESRKASKKSQREMADAIGVKERAIRFYESGDREPTFDQLLTLSELLGVSADYLIGRSDVRGDEKVDRDFAKWVEENVSATFFYDFHRSPEESKAQLMRDLRMAWEYERRQKKS